MGLILVFKIKAKQVTNERFCREWETTKQGFLIRLNHMIHRNPLSQSSKTKDKQLIIMSLKLWYIDSHTILLIKVHIVTLQFV